MSEDEETEAVSSGELYKKERSTGPWRIPIDRRFAQAQYAKRLEGKIQDVGHRKAEDGHSRILGHGKPHDELDHVSKRTEERIQWFRLS
jgi:hypothetical protein